jgi:membrane-associated PAP2 superfamily phosphatase
MTLESCKIPADQQDAVRSSSAARPADGLNRVFDFLSGMFKYVIHAPPVWIPLALLVSATIIFWVTDIDLQLSRPFYISGGSYMESNSHWPLRSAQPWKSLNNYGVYPAMIIGAGGLLVFVISLFWSKLRAGRDAGLFFALMLALGPGLLINGIFKPYWGRPRPNDTIPLGGQRAFLPVGDIGISDGASFPSGHASMGFYLMAPGFVFYRRRPRLAAAFFILGLAGGTIMGLARIVGGSHFASDVVWSAGIVYFTGLALSAVFRFGVKDSGFRIQGSESN